MSDHKSFHYKRAREEIASGETKRAKRTRSAENRKGALEVDCRRVLSYLREALNRGDVKYSTKVLFKPSDADTIRAVMQHAVQDNGEVAEFLFLNIYRVKDGVPEERLEHIPVQECLKTGLPATTMRWKHRIYALSAEYEEKEWDPEESSNDADADKPIDVSAK